MRRQKVETGGTLKIRSPGFGVRGLLFSRISVYWRWHPQRTPMPPWCLMHQLVAGMRAVGKIAEIIIECNFCFHITVTCCHPCCIFPGAWIAAAWFTSFLNSQLLSALHASQTSVRTKSWGDAGPFSLSSTVPLLASPYSCHVQQDQKYSQIIFVHLKFFL